MGKPTTTQDKAIDKINAVKKAKVIELYRQTFGHITDSCAGAGIHRSTFYNWMEKDPDFAKEIVNAESELNDDIREVLINKAASGDMTAVIFYLKSRHPDFKQNNGFYQQINVNKAGEMGVQIIDE